MQLLSTHSKNAAWQRDRSRSSQVTLTMCGIGLRYLLNDKLKMTVLSRMNFLHSQVQVKYFLVLKVVTLILPVQMGICFFKSIDGSDHSDSHTKVKRFKIKC